METQLKGPITKDMNIAELAKLYPEAVAVMAENGLHCFGCHGAAFDTVEAGAKGHGMEQEAIDKMVDDMNEMVALKKSQKAHAPEVKGEIKLTEKAAKKLVQLMAEEKKEGYGLRLDVVPGGCSGFQYALDFDNAAKADDVTLTQHNIKIFVSKESLSQINGTTIDYVDGLQGSGFKIENPNAHSSCGCGKSFA